jgi:hypothetical protein
MVDLQIRDVHVTFSMSLTELKHLHRASCLAEIDIRTEEDPRNAPAAEYFTKEFFPFIDNLVKDAEKYVT